MPANYRSNARDAGSLIYHRRFVYFPASKKLWKSRRRPGPGSAAAARRRLQPQRRVWSVADQPLPVKPVPAGGGQQTLALLLPPVELAKRRQSESASSVPKIQSSFVFVYVYCAVRLLHIYINIYIYTHARALRGGAGWEVHSARWGGAGGARNPGRHPKPRSDGKPEPPG